MIRSRESYGCCGGQQSSFEANVCGLAETGLAAGTPAEHAGREHVFSFATPLTAADSALRDFIYAYTSTFKILREDE